MILSLLFLWFIKSFLKLPVSFLEQYPFASKADFITMFYLVNCYIIDLLYSS